MIAFPGEYARLNTAVMALRSDGADAVDGRRRDEVDTLRENIGDARDGGDIDPCRADALLARLRSFVIVALLALFGGVCAENGRDGEGNKHTRFKLNRGDMQVAMNRQELVDTRRCGIIEDNIWGVEFPMRQFLYRNVDGAGRDGVREPIADWEWWTEEMVPVYDYRRGVWRIMCADGEQFMPNPPHFKGHIHIREAPRLKKTVTECDPQDADAITPRLSPP